MLKTLFLKEIQDSIHSYKFIMVFILCLILIPLSIYVTLKDYEQKLNDYNDSIRLYQERSEGQIDGMFSAEGYHPPSNRSVFAAGLEPYFPQKVVTSRNGLYQMLSVSSMNNPQSLLFGKIDFLFNVSFVLSLMALIFTFHSITGEKEMGTLRLIMSSSVPRWKILLAKILGNYLVFLIPFITGLLAAMLVVQFSGMISLFSKTNFPAFFLIICLTLLFLYLMFNLGIFISTRTRRSITSMVMQLFIWVFLVMIIPKTGPMIAQIIHPIKSQQVINIEKQIIKQNLDKECTQKKGELLETICNKQGMPIREALGSNKWQAIKDQYDQEKNRIDDDYNERISNALTSIDQQYFNERNAQAGIAMNLSRISPVSCYTYILSELAGTGVLEWMNFQQQARQFQKQAEKDIYNNFIRTTYSDASGQRFMTKFGYPKGFNASKVPVPHFSDYQHVTMTDVLRNRWLDILLLILFSVLFFAATYVSFLKYDVR